MRRLFASPGAPYLLLTLAILLWASNTVVGRAVRDAIPPLAFAFWRWLLATVIILAISRRHVKRDWAVIRRSGPILLLLSAIGGSGGLQSMTH